MPPSTPPTPEPTPTSERDLSTTTATTPQDLTTSLHLLADSVAQQRQTAAWALISHPLWLGTLLAALSVLYTILDPAMMMTTAAGCVMVWLTIVRVLSAGYIEQAEKVGYDWLQGPGPERPEGPGKGKKEQVVLVTRFKGRIIGTVVLCQNKRRGVIRGWTVERRYRGCGIGRELLEEAVKECRGRGWEGPVFDEGHVHAKRVLPSWLDGFEKRERRAREVLEGIKQTL